jgi:hypothetical protein
VRRILIAFVLAVLIAAALTAGDAPRFTIRDWTKLGDHQSAYILQDSRGRTYACVLVVESVYGGTIAVTSQPWGCQ